jgi:hypothetical protein
MVTYPIISLLPRPPQSLDYKLCGGFDLDFYSI